MRIRFSPLIAGMSGKAADAVASSWKGRAYIRKLVIPHNPKSAAQTLVRDSLTRCVTLWRSLSSDIKKWLDTYATAYRMSGYNTFMSKNRAIEQAETALVPVPANPHVVAPTDAAFVTGIGVSGDIDLTWTDDTLPGITHVIAAVRLAGIDSFEKIETVAVATATLTISDLTAAGDYDCYCWYHNETTDEMGTVHGQLAVAAMT